MGDSVRKVPEADIDPLFDHLVSAGKERRRDVETKGPRGLEVNGQLVFGWRLKQQVSRFLALENAIDITGSAPELMRVNEALSERVPPAVG